jgi:hypothetical protein
MLGVLVRPQNPAGLAAAGPELVHVLEQVELAVGLEPALDGLALVGRDRGTVREAVGGVGGWVRINLAAVRKGIGEYLHRESS